MRNVSDAPAARWIDHQSYFGPDRRLRAVLRVRERRRLNLCSHPPTLSRALRKLKLGVLDARGHKGVGDFADLVRNVAMLAELYDASDVSDRLNWLARRLYAHRDEDKRPMIYDALDRLHADMDVMH